MPATRISASSCRLHLPLEEVQEAAGVAQQLLAGVAVDGDREVQPVVHVVQDLLDRRAACPPRCGPGGRRRAPGVSRTVSPRRKVRRPRSPRLAAVVGHRRGLGRRLRRRRARWRAPRRSLGRAHDPVEVEQVLAAWWPRRARPSRARPGPVRRSPRARASLRACARAAAAPPRSRCCRTGCRGSWARAAGWSGSTIAAPIITSSSGLAEHRPRVHAVQLGVVERRVEAPALRRAAPRGWTAGCDCSASPRSMPARVDLGRRCARTPARATATRHADPPAAARGRARRRSSNRAASPGPGSSIAPLLALVALAAGGEEAHGRAQFAARHRTPARSPCAGGRTSEVSVSA